MKTFIQYLEELRNPKEIGIFRSKVKNIKQVDTRNSSWQITLPELFREYGFKELGSGKYGVVFENPKYPYIIKVFMKDAAYERWISFCLKNQSNPYIPKIRGKVIKINDMFRAIRIEKLKFGNFYETDFYVDFQEFLRDNSYLPIDVNRKQIFEHFKKNKNLLDLHGENVMFRGKQLVIIDPYYNWFNKHKAMDYTIDPNEIDQSIF